MLQLCDNFPTMFSLQRLLSRDDKFYDLMEGSAREARAAIDSIVTLLRTAPGKRSLDSFSDARREEKRLAVELSEELCRTFVTPLEREDIETLSHALYKIPKTAEKFGERFLLAGEATRGLDFSRHAELLERAAVLLEPMVKELRSGVELQTVKKQNLELQRIEGEGDKLMLQTLHELFTRSSDPFAAMLAKDLLELLEKVLDRCRDAGNIVFSIILKHS
jgi:uncharacterized protein